MLPISDFGLTKPTETMHILLAHFCIIMGYSMHSKGKVEASLPITKGKADSLPHSTALPTKSDDEGSTRNGLMDIELATLHVHKVENKGCQFKDLGALYPNFLLCG
jgi:hypothetical protein